MNIQKLSEVIKHGSINVFLGAKTNSKKAKYKIYRISVSEKIKDWLKEKHINFIVDNDMPVTEYNPIISQSDSIEKISTESINGITDLRSRLANIDTTQDINKFKAKFMIIKYEYNGDEFLILRRIFGENRLGQSILAKFQDGYFDKIESKNAIFFDQEIDMIILDGTTYVYSHISVERIFFMLEQFKNNAQEVLKRIEDVSEGKIKDFPSIKDKILNHGRNVRRVAKLQEDGSRATLFLENFKRTVDTIEELNLNINISKENEQHIIDITDDTEINELINLMQDSYYKTIIGGRDGIDEFN